MFLCTNSTKFGAQVRLPKPYISTKFGTICSKIEENMSDTVVDKTFNQFVDMSTGKTVGAIVLKFLSATNLT